MDDLEISVLCAEAMEIRYGVGYRSLNLVTMEPSGAEQILVGSATYDPLHDDARAMALVKKFELNCYPPRITDGKRWEVYGENNGFAENSDLNRAICECVANMQKAKL